MRKKKIEMVLLNLIFFFTVTMNFVFLLPKEKMCYISFFIIFFVPFKGTPLSHMLTMKIYSCKPGGNFFF